MYIYFLILNKISYPRGCMCFILCSLKTKNICNINIFNIGLSKCNNLSLSVFTNFGYYDHTLYNIFCNTFNLDVSKEVKINIVGIENILLIRIVAQTLMSKVTHSTFKMKLLNFRYSATLVKQEIFPGYFRDFADFVCINSDLKSKSTVVFFSYIYSYWRVQLLICLLKCS